MLKDLIGIKDQPKEQQRARGATYIELAINEMGSEIRFLRLIFFYQNRLLVTHAGAAVHDERISEDDLYSAAREDGIYKQADCAAGGLCEEPPYH
jgi:hypothetical protein